MTVKDAITDLLNESRVSKIDFSMDASAITRRGFNRVRDAVQNGQIKVVVDSTMPTGAGASYNDADNEIGYEDGLTGDQVSSSVQMRALFLHECAHAVVDANQTSLKVLADESAGYLVQIMYRLIAGQTHIRRWAEQNQTNPDGRVWFETIKVIDKLGLLNRCVMIQSNRDCADLMNAIKAHPVYRGTRDTDHSRCNGI